jgi:hypothetical protein
VTYLGRLSYYRRYFFSPPDKNSHQNISITNCTFKDFNFLRSYDSDAAIDRNEPSLGVVQLM